MTRFIFFLKLFVGILVAAVLVVNIVVGASTKQYIFNDVSKVSKAEVAVILGAAIFPNGALTQILKDRVDMAIALYKSGKVSKILVSGDNGTVSHNEVDPVGRYLLLNGIPDQDVFLDHAGFDTYSTMYRARDIFKTKSIIITTQAFHLPRAVFIARGLGLEAYGVSADVVTPLFKNYIREIFANEKAVLDLITNRTPKFLGEEIPITGTSTPAVATTTSR